MCPKKSWNPIQTYGDNFVFLLLEFEEFFHSQVLNIFG